MRFPTRPLLLSSMIALAACSGDISKTVEKSTKSDEENIQRYSEFLKESTQDRKVALSDTIEGLYLAPYLISEAASSPIPDAWLQENGGWSIAGDSSIYDVAKALMYELGVPVQIYDQLPVELEQATTTNVQGGSADQEEEKAIPKESKSSKSVYDLLNRRHSVSVQGSWLTRIKQIAALYRVDWDYEDGIIKFRFFDTRPFAIRHTAGDLEVSSSVVTSGADGGGNISSNGSQAISSQAKISVWEDITTNIKAIVPGMSSVVASPALGTVTVTTLASRMPEVARYFDGLNDRLGRQVAFSVDIYSVTLSNKESSTFNMNLAFKDLRDRFGFDFKGIASTEPGASVLTGAIISPPRSSDFAEFAGTSVIAEALRTVGDVSTVYSDNQIVKNYLPTAFQLANQISYIKERQLTTNPLGGVQTAVKPGTVSTGYKLQLLPNIHGDGTLTLKISMSISQLEALKTIGGTTEVIQSPNINVGDLLNEVFVASGDMIVLSGFEQVTSRTDELDGGNGLCFLCRSGSAEQEKRKFFVVVRPHILKAPRTMQTASR